MARTTKTQPAPEPPADATEDEIARWFNENDMSDYDFEEVSDAGPPRPPVGAKPLETVAIRLPAWEIAEVRRRAEHIGIGYTTYIRMLVHQHVRSQATHPLDG